MFKNLDEIPNKMLFLPADQNGREIYIFHLKQAIVVGESLFYPNPLLYTFEENIIYRPIRETIMSLAQIESATHQFIPPTSYDSVVNDRVFFFIYNTDNYYHFLYDTLPYLITFKHLRKTMKIKLLMNFPNHQMTKLYRFVIEFLEILGITKDDILIVKDKTLYKNIYLSTSYTHGINSNLPPREEIYSFYKRLSSITIHTKFPKKIYVSRRTWIHNDTTNIGTNYTQRRAMINETDLVEYLMSVGYFEVFTENLTTVEKIQMFKNATHVIGAAGGGISNVLFSPPSCNLLAICSPGFLDVNTRFKYSMCKVNSTIFSDTAHVGGGEFLNFMRVKYGDIIGEIVNISGSYITISYSNQFVAGWNSNLKLKTITVLENQCIKLDDGLNSPWIIDLDKIKNLTDI